MAKSPKKGIIAGACAAIGLTAIIVTANVNFDSQMGKAREYISNTEYSKAAEILNEHKSKNSAQEDVYLLYADYYIAQEDYKSAVEILKEGAGKAQNTNKINAKLDEINDLYKIELSQSSVESEISNSNIGESRSNFDKIIASDDLPQYYGGYKEAQEFSKRFDKGVVSTDSYSFDSDVTILSISGYWRDDEINSIEVYFKNADVAPDYDEAQEILNKFLPPNIISRYYGTPTVDLYTPNDIAECSVITVCYPLNEEGKTKDNLNGQLGMVYNIKDDVCLSACIRFGVPWRGFTNYTHQVLESPSDIPAESSTSTVIESIPTESNSSAPVGNENNSENHFNDYSTPEQQNTTKIVLNTSTKKYHYPHCSEVKKIKPENYATIGSESEAISEGYTACKKCH